jgi:hypothetical protein
MSSTGMNCVRMLQCSVVACADLSYYISIILGHGSNTAEEPLSPFHGLESDPASLKRHLQALIATNSAVSVEKADYDIRSEQGRRLLGATFGT